MTEGTKLEVIAHQFCGEFEARVSTLSYTRPNKSYSGDKHWIGHSKEGLSLEYRSINGTEYFWISKGDEGKLTMIGNGENIMALYQNPLMSDSDSFFSIPPIDIVDTRENPLVIRHLKSIMTPHIDPYDENTGVALDLSYVQHGSILKIMDFLAGKLKDIPATR